MPYTEMMAMVYYGTEMMLDPYVAINEGVRRHASMVAPGSTKSSAHAHAGTARERGQT